MKRTFQPSNLVRKRRHGFRSRMATPTVRAILRKLCVKCKHKFSALNNLTHQIVYYLFKKSKRI